MNHATICTKGRNIQKMKYIKHLKFCSTLWRNEIFLHVSSVHFSKAQQLQTWQSRKPNKMSLVPKLSLNVLTSQYEYEKYGCSRMVTCCTFSILSVNADRGGIILPLFNKGQRNISLMPSVFFPQRLNPSSKLEETVQDLKDKAKEQIIESPSGEPEKKKEKKPIMQRIKAELLHFYHGFRLLFLNTRICLKYFLKTLSGRKLTRREHKLMTRTLGDLFRLVPFSVFIIVPFLEFTLPIFLKIFPGMLPSTFETKSQKESKIKKNFQIQLQTAAILRDTLQSMAVQGKGHESENAAKFVSFFEKVRTSGGVVTSEEVMKFSKMFRDEVTLDYLSRAQLKALCRILGLKSIGTTNFLRFQLRIKLRSLHADDQLIHKEGVNSLSVDELQAACQARGMPAWGVSEERLKQQLNNWLVHSVEKKVCPSLLVLSQAFMLPSSTSTEEKLAATIQSLPAGVVTATKAEIEVREGKIDYKTKLDLIREEMDKISKESQEISEELRLKKAEKEKVITDPHKKPLEAKKPVETSTEKPEEEVVNVKEIEALRKVLGREHLLEKEKLAELMNEMEHYEQDSKELTAMLKTLQKSDVGETVAAKRLKKKLKKMITNLDTTLSKLEGREKVLKEMQSKKDKPQPPRSRLIKVDEFIESLKTLPGEASLNHERLIEIVHRIDKNKDGFISADLLTKMIDILSQEEVTITKKQVNELIDLLGKEDILAIDMQILKALNKDDTVSELKKELEKRRAEIVEELKKEKKESDLKRKEEQKTEMQKSEQIQNIKK